MYAPVSSLVKFICAFSKNFNHLLGVNLALELELFLSVLYFSNIENNF